MNFMEAYKLVYEEKAFAVRRAGKPSHVGSSGDGYVDAYYLLRCCNSACLYMHECHAIHLTLEDILANDWEVK
jgi:hypothetical protein